MAFADASCHSPTRRSSCRLFHAQSGVLTLCRDPLTDACFTEGNWKLLNALTDSRFHALLHPPGRFDTRVLHSVRYAGQIVRPRSAADPRIDARTAARRGFPLDAGGPKRRSRGIWVVHALSGRADGAASLARPVDSQRKPAQIVAACRAVQQLDRKNPRSRRRPAHRLRRERREKRLGPRVRARGGRADRRPAYLQSDQGHHERRRPGGHFPAGIDHSVCIQPGTPADRLAQHLPPDRRVSRSSF